MEKPLIISLMYFILYLKLLQYKFLSLINKFATPTYIYIYQIIFKADDLTGLQKQVKKLDKIIQKENIKISWGIIGNSMENPSDEYLTFLKEKQNDEKYHFFNHGYTHYHDSATNDKYEFTARAIEQFESLKKTQEIVKNKAGIILNTFGAPFNHINKDTEISLSQFEEIKYWYFGLSSSNKTIITRDIDIEKSVGRPDIFFLKRFFKYNKINKNILTLQIHPYMWDSIDFLQFRVCIAYLKSIGVKFITPNEL